MNWQSYCHEFGVQFFLAHPDVLGVMCAQLTRDLFAIAKFLFIWA